MDPRIVSSILGTILFAVLASPQAIALLAPFNTYVSFGIRIVVFSIIFYILMMAF